MWFVNCPGTEWKATKEDIIDKIKSGLFGELELEFPELAHHYKPPNDGAEACATKPLPP